MIGPQLVEWESALVSAAVRLVIAYVDSIPYGRLVDKTSSWWAPSLVQDLSGRLAIYKRNRYDRLAR
jgi:hypothetical protein